ncbi:uncharacterized mitochondrial protein-like protein [Tanacetum coccineum]
MRFPDIPSTSIKLMLFPFSLEGSARIWLEKEPPRSILTWDDLVSNFINQFFPPSKTKNLGNEIMRFQQRFDKSFYEAWDRFKDLLRACPHHGFSELHQLDTFYNALNANDQDSFRAKVSSNASTPGISPDVAALITEVSELKNMMKTMLIDKQKAQAPAPVKAVKQSCVTCGVYQAPTQQMQGVSKTDFENYVKANDAVLPNMQNQGQGTLPSQTVTNPREHVNAITTRSDKTCEGPSTPLVPTTIVFTPLKEPEQNPETSMDKLQKHSSPVKTSDNLEEFADELTLLKKEDVENEELKFQNSDEPVLLNTPLSDKVECSDPEVDIDEIDAFLAMEVSFNFEEGYFDSEGDVFSSTNLLVMTTTHNRAPKNDPLHHEFAGELLTLPSRIAREHEEYLSRMTVLCEISTSQSPENLPISRIPVENSNPEEIDIFLVPGDLIPPGVENDDSEDEDNYTFLPEHESPNLDHQDNPSSPRPQPEPPDVCLNFKPDTAMKNDFNQGEIVLSLNVKDVNSFTFFSYLEPVVFSMEVSYSKIDPKFSEDSRVRCQKADHLAQGGDVPSEKYYRVISPLISLFYGGTVYGYCCLEKSHKGTADWFLDGLVLLFRAKYSLNSKAFRVFNSRTRIVEENLHIRFSGELPPNAVGRGTRLAFDIDALTKTMNYELIVEGTQSNGFTDPNSSHDDGSKPSSDDGKKVDEDSKCNDQEKKDNVNSTNNVNAASTNEVNVIVSPILSTRIHKDHHLDQVIGDLQSATQTRKMSKNLKEHGFVRRTQKGNSCIEGSKLDRGYAGRAFTIQVTRRYTREEGIDYDEVFALVARIEAIRLFLAYASFKDFVVYQMDVKNAFLYRKIEEEVYQKKDGIFISQDKYVVEILKKFGFTEVKTASIPIETQKPLLKDENGVEVDVHMYSSMIGSLMYLTSSRPDIMFAVCACARYQVNQKVLHLYDVKRIFRYLKGQPKLSLWYPKDSPFDLVAYTNSDYAGASLDRKSTIGGFQFLGCRLISWQCKKQTVVANSITEAEYVAASSCCGQVLWIQNQLLDYGYNFMHTKIFIDNNRKAKKSVKLMMEKLFGMELKLMLVTQK